MRCSLDALFGETATILPGDAERRQAAEGAVASGLCFCGFNIAPAGLLREIARQAPRIAEAIAAA